MNTLTKLNFDGVLNYISQYKQLTIKSTEEQAKQLAELIDKHFIEFKLDEDNGDKKPYNISDKDGFYYFKVKLSKYEKPLIEKYDRLTKSNLKCFISLNHYNSDEYGEGLNLTLIKYKKLKDTPKEKDEDEDDEE